MGAEKYAQPRDGSIPISIGIEIITSFLFLKRDFDASIISTRRLFSLIIISRTLIMISERPRFMVIGFVTAALIFKIIPLGDIKYKRASSAEAERRTIPILYFRLNNKTIKVRIVKSLIISDIDFHYSLTK